ncbi:alginate lyase family protein [Chitinophaga sp. GCM10012297]|uniref:Alginate lyase family protein n=1 Tax=Chitinophaga chungangae TaxID=2821488 RepID=A0ABS3Y9G3_9BACT|nr:alginate lyase family protein [Chitinophaga chungangae]MBO9150774.1 alginate lyase family protein [Chitinophaga chungangae]
MILRSLKTSFLLPLFLLCATGLSAQQHPGGMHPKAQIDYVKEQVRLKKEPFLSAEKQLLSKADEALSATHHALADFDIPGYYIKPKEHRENSQSIQTDGFAAYSCALAWQLTGKKKYAEKALYFLNAWAATNTTYSNYDGALVLSYSGTSMVMAAELARDFKGWKKADRERFAGWVKNVYRKATNEIRNRKNNWADWGRFGSILADYYLDDQTDLAENVRLIKSDLFEKIAADGHMPEEVRREKNGIWYTYFSLAPITAACWVTYNATGENLFALEKEGRSIKKALDYLLYYQQHPSEWKWFANPNLGSPNSGTGFWPANLLESMYGIYKDASYQNFTAPYRPIVYEKHHFAWTFPTLMPVAIGGYK